MSNMLEQAIVDAAALREAALKNAEQSIIEKYAPQIKEAVKSMLENETTSNKRMYQGRSVDVIHEADEDGNVTVSESGGKPFLVKETDLSEATEDQILQEEEMDAAGDSTTAPPTEIEAPPSWDSRYDSTQSVTLTAMLDNVDDDGNIEIDLDDIELSLAQQEQAEEATADMAIAAPTDSVPDASDMEAGADVGTGEEEGLGGLVDDLEGTDLQLQELLSVLSEYDEEMLEEDLEVDMGATKLGSHTTNETTLQYESDKEAAHNEHMLEEDEESTEDEEEIQETLQEILRLQETFSVLEEQNKKLENVVHELNNKLEETLLSNAKLLYQNRTLNDASLNERQKTKIVEAIANAESPKEAKSLHETLRATVGSDQKRSPQSLNETVNRRSNLSSMLNTRQNLNESQNSDPFFDKMKKLAGIKK